MEISWKGKETLERVGNWGIYILSRAKYKNNEAALPSRKHKTGASLYVYPTESASALELQNPFYDVSKLHKVRLSRDFDVLKL